MFVNPELRADHRLDDTRAHVGHLDFVFVETIGVQQLVGDFESLVGAGF
jgi:hypothetical protein